MSFLFSQLFASGLHTDDHFFTSEDGGMAMASPGSLAGGSMHSVASKRDQQQGGGRTADGNNLAMTGGGRRSSKGGGGAGGGMFARAKASEQARDVERMNAEVLYRGSVFCLDGRFFVLGFGCFYLRSLLCFFFDLFTSCFVFSVFFCVAFLRCFLVFRIHFVCVCFFFFARWICILLLQDPPPIFVFGDVLDSSAQEIEVGMGTAVMRSARLCESVFVAFCLVCWC